MILPAKFDNLTFTNLVYLIKYKNKGRQEKFYSILDHFHL